MLTIDQLFTPEQSGVGLNPNLAPAADTWLASLLSTATALGLPTTSWQPGAPERTILAIAAVALQQEDALISLMAQGGFLDFAASGTVSTTGLTGVVVTAPVTPDPSIPSQNPDGSPGWLDALCESFYNVTRLQATYATGQLAIANTGAGTLSYVTGNYHVANVATSATYANTGAMSVPPSIAGTISAVATGAGTTTFTTLAAHGLSVGDVVYVSGTLGVTFPTGFEGFAFVTSTPTVTTFAVAVTTSGTWTSGGSAYKCTVVEMRADVRGITSNAAPGAVTVTVTKNVGVFVSNLTAWSAANFESNLAYVTRTRLKLGALSPNGPNAAYEYFALTAQQLLAAQTPAVVLTNGPIAKAITFSNPQTEVTTTVIASSTPVSSTLGAAVTPGCSQLAITGATNASPIAITTASAHNLNTGDDILISGVLGNTAANGGGVIIKTGASTFTINGSTGNGAYTGGGFVEGGDLGQVDALLQANVVPDGITAVAVSALAFPVTIVTTVVVPQSFVATYTLAAPIALQALIDSFPIGGNIPPGGSAGTIPYSVVEGALVEAGVLTVGAVSYVRQVSSLTVNGVVVDVNYPSPLHDAVLVTPSITVVGI